MKRLFLAGFLAVVLHSVLLWTPVPWSKPVLLAPQSRTVDIQLVTAQKPMEKRVDRPVAPKPEKVQPQPKPKPVPKPVQKTVPQSKVRPTPTPAPRPVPPEPAAPSPTPPLENATATPLPESVAAPQAQSAKSADEQAAIQVSVPRYDINPPPKYPQAARRRHYQGTVLLDVRVTPQGRAAEVKVIQSSGYPILDESALSTVRQWRFTPARRGMQPIEMWVEVPVRFALN